MSRANTKGPAKNLAGPSADERPYFLLLVFLALFFVALRTARFTAFFATFLTVRFFALFTAILSPPWLGC
jgi:hypothetical protein